MRGTRHAPSLTRAAPHRVAALEDAHVPNHVTRSHTVSFVSHVPDARAQTTQNKP